MNIIGINTSPRLLSYKPDFIRDCILIILLCDLSDKIIYEKVHILPSNYDPNDNVFPNFQLR